MTFKKIYALASVSILTAATLSLLACDNNKENACVREFAPRNYSPDRKHYIQMNEINCGGTSTRDLSIKLVNTDREHSFRPVFASTGKIEDVKVVWLDNSHYQISGFSVNDLIYFSNNDSSGVFPKIKPLHVVN